MNSQGTSEFQPSVEWLNEDDCDTLLLYLPGFAKEQLRVQLRSRTLIISGERMLHDNTNARFQKQFHVSQHCDVNKISAKFESSILSVKQPKSTTKNEENTIDGFKEYQEKAQVKTATYVGEYGVVKNRKDGNFEGKVGELKGTEGVCENASKKKVVKLKPWRERVMKVLVFVVGFGLGVYCTKLIHSRTA